MTFASYVAIGDSFTEGMGDDQPGDKLRGWADLVALGLSLHRGEPIGYANLAIRGRKLEPIIAEQLEPALAMAPELMSLNGGGNDILRPRVSLSMIVDRLDEAVQAGVDRGVHVLLLSGANPAGNLPLGDVMNRRGDALVAEMLTRYPRPGTTMVDNWSDPVLRAPRYWSVDKMHLSALGHIHVAGNVLTGLGVPVPPQWRIAETAALPAEPRGANDMRYYREFVLPWIGRRLTGRSSGDHRTARIPALAPALVRAPFTD